MKISFAGWSMENIAGYEYLKKIYGADFRNFEITIHNESPASNIPDEQNIKLKCLEGERPVGLVGKVTDLSYFDGVEDADLIIYQPTTAKNLEKKYGIDSPIWLKAKTIQHLFFENCPTNNIVGVTGTKGKGTTTTLISKMIEANGSKIHVGGNIGIPTISFIDEIKPQDWVILELSSFQLYRFPYSPHIAVHLMMMPEHIEEWHKTMDDYVEAKRNIFAHQTEEDFAVYYPANKFSRDNVQASAGKHIPYTEAPGAFLDIDGNIQINGQKIVHRSELKLLGDHNIQNVCAAVTAAWQVHQNIQALRQVLTSFSGLEHRLELAGKINDVKYYDDSFGTTPDTAIVAMDAFVEPKIMIVGGHDKGNPMEAMAARLAGQDIKHIVFIGSTGQKLLEMAKAAGLDENKATIREDGNSWTMPEVVKVAQEKAEPGDIVLLSTGCASFGLFQDYKDRGRQFHEAVKAAGAV